jgi:hypothetical protein
MIKRIKRTNLGKPKNRISTPSEDFFQCSICKSLFSEKDFNKHVCITTRS